MAPAAAPAATGRPASAAEPADVSPIRTWIGPVGAFALAGLVLATPFAAAAAPARPAAVVLAEDELDAFYDARGGEPLWLDRGAPRPAAEALLKLLEAAAEDGLDPGRYNVGRVREAVYEKRRTMGATLRDDKILSTAFARWASDLATPAPGIPIHYVDAELAPPRLTPLQWLQQAAAAPALNVHLAQLRRHNPLYERLRPALATATGETQRRTIRANLERLRALPRDLGRRFILVDTASARLWAYENGRPVKSMKVVVGKPGMETPMMAGLIRYVALRPYWNLPPDLVRDSYAPKAVREGWQSIVKHRFEVLSDWSDDPKKLDPKKVDWAAVAAGTKDVRVRQLPGAGNMMGAVKFMFPNELGIYLHDTPGRWAFLEASRRFSAGCVRLEDAKGLLAWAFGGKAPAYPKANREKAVNLPAPVPVYITYLTALPDANGRVVFQTDVEGRDAALLAGLDAARVTPRAGRVRGGSANGSGR